MPHTSPVLLRPRAAVFRAVADALPRHPLLSGRVKTWRIRDGKTTDDDPPSEGQLPWVRLTPVALPEVRETRTTHACPLQVDVEIATPRAGGSDGLLDLADRIHAALFRQDNQVTRNLRAAVRAAGGSEIVPGPAVLPGSGQDFGQGIVSGKGSFVVNIFIKLR